MTQLPTLEELWQRVRRVEDELAVRRLIVSYGLAVDAGDRQALVDLLTEDAIYELDSARIVGRRAIIEAIFSGEHRGTQAIAAHTIGPEVVDLEGDRAVVRGYSRLYVMQEDAILLWRLSFNRWECVRSPSGWRIALRVTRLMSADQASFLLLPHEASFTQKR